MKVIAMIVINPSKISYLINQVSNYLMKNFPSFAIGITKIQNISQKGNIQQSKTSSQKSQKTKTKIQTVGRKEKSAHYVLTFITMQAILLMKVMIVRTREMIKQYQNSTKTVKMTRLTIKLFYFNSNPHSKNLQQRNIYELGRCKVL